jgi:hypothetical protein
LFPDQNSVILAWSLSKLTKIIRKRQEKYYRRHSWASFVYSFYFLEQMCLDQEFYLIRNMRVSMLNITTASNSGFPDGLSGKPGHFNFFSKKSRRF